MTGKVDELAGQRRSENRPLLAIFFGVSSHDGDKPHRRDKEFESHVLEKLEPSIEQLIRIIFPKKKAVRACLGELKKKDWGVSGSEIGSLSTPFLIIFETDFNRFKPKAMNWLVIKSVHSTKAADQFEDLAKMLAPPQGKSPLSHFAAWLKGRSGGLVGLPKMFGGGPDLIGLIGPGISAGRPAGVNWNAASAELLERDKEGDFASKEYWKERADGRRLNRGKVVSALLEKSKNKNLSLQKPDTAYRNLKAVLDEIEQKHTAI